MVSFVDLDETLDNIMNKASDISKGKLSVSNQLMNKDLVLCKAF